MRGTLHRGSHRLADRRAPSRFRFVALHCAAKPSSNFANTARAMPLTSTALSKVNASSGNCADSHMPSPHSRSNINQYIYDRI